MNNPSLKVLLPASLLAFLASVSLPALRADDAPAATVGALTDSGASVLDSGGKSPDSAATVAAKKGKKKHGKKKHGKKAKATPASDSSPAGAAAPAADAGK